MLSFLDVFSDSVQPTDATVELEAAARTKEVDDIAESGSFMKNIWEHYCLFYALVAFNDLRVADVMGDECLTTDELMDRCRLSNKHAFDALCEVLRKHDVLCLDQGRLSLGRYGAILQNGLTSKYTDVLEHMAASRTLSAWRGLSSMIANSSASPINKVDATVSTLLCPDWQELAKKEIDGGVHSVNLDRSMRGKIGVWSFHMDLDRMQDIFPNANIYKVHDDDIASFEEDTDLFVFHRVLTLFGISTTMNKAALKLKSDGRAIVIDCVKHPSLAADNLFMHVAGIPECMTENEWDDLFKDDFVVNSLSLVCEGMAVFDLTPRVLLHV